MLGLCVRGDFLGKLSCDLQNGRKEERDEEGGWTGVSIRCAWGRCLSYYVWDFLDTGVVYTYDRTILGAGGQSRYMNTDRIYTRFVVKKRRFCTYIQRNYLCIRPFLLRTRDCQHVPKGSPNVRKLRSADSFSVQMNASPRPQYRPT